MEFFLRRVSELILQYADFPLGAVDASVIAVRPRQPDRYDAALK
ncbi:hypothetical protein [Streptomyces sp. NPDC050528]